MLILPLCEYLFINYIYAFLSFLSSLSSFHLRDLRVFLAEEAIFTAPNLPFLAV